MGVADRVGSGAPGIVGHALHAVSDRLIAREYTNEIVIRGRCENMG